MAVLVIVPNIHLRQVRQDFIQRGKTLLPVTLGSLASLILKEGLVSYREDKVVEEVAVWQAVQTANKNLEYFRPIAHYSGFVQELKWLFSQMDFGEEILEKLPAEGKHELLQLHSAYHNFLKEQGVLDRGGQFKTALELAKRKRFLPHVEAFELRGLAELSPLETEFIQTLAQERTVKHHTLQVESSQIDVFKAQDPRAEVEMIGIAIRNDLEQGIPLREIRLAFPNLEQYLPILMPTFQKLGIPWHTPSLSVSNTPLGKGILNLILGELEGWHKHHLQLLTAPGWGLPFDLNYEDHRKLRLAPPIKGLLKWRSYLGEVPRWEKVLELISAFSKRLIVQTVADFGICLEELLGQFHPKYTVDLEKGEDFAQVVKAWDALSQIVTSFQNYSWICTPREFFQLLQSVLNHYQVATKRDFREQLQILRVDQLGTTPYAKVYVGGLVEGQFPGLENIHWLTKIRKGIQGEQIYQQLSAAGTNVYLYYPEVDLEGKLNLPSTMLPKVKKDKSPYPLTPPHHPTLFLGEGVIQDGELLNLVQKRILKEGLTASQLNSYANCPYQFFCSYVLQVKHFEVETLELDAGERGTIVHKALFRFWQRYLTGALPHLEQAQGELEGIVRELYEEHGENPSLKLIRSLRWFMRQDLGRVEMGFRPQHLEKKFSALTINTSLGPVRIRGQIDRIDVGPQGAYVLYDYKTGVAPSIRDIVLGRDLQIAIYLLAAQGLLPGSVNIGAAYYLLRTARPVGVFNSDFHKQLLIRTNFGCLDGERFQNLVGDFQNIIQVYLEAIFEGDFPIEPVSSWICRYCPFQGICRKEGVTAL